MKIFCIGRNYAEHAKELSNDLPTEPVIFMKPHTALLKDNQPFYHPDFSKNIHYECELVLRVCKNGKQIQEKFAHKYFDAISLGIDFTARDIQDQQKTKGLPWEIAKAFDHSAVLGTWVELDEAQKMQNFQFQFFKNNELVQQGDTSNLLFNFSRLIYFISKYFTLNTGDLIYTGTPAGVGPIAIGDIYVAKYNDAELLRCAIK